MIQPTPGRIVWYYPAKSETIDQLYEAPLAAIVVAVWHDRMVNLTVFDANGVAHPRTSVTLVQEGDDVLRVTAHAGWMPYQVSQAKKHEPRKAQTDPEDEERPEPKGASSLLPFQMNELQLMHYMGDDAAKWAKEFCRIASEKRFIVDEDLMRGWFANAIEHSNDVRRWRRMQGMLAAPVSAPATGL